MPLADRRALLAGAGAALLSPALARAQTPAASFSVDAYVPLRIFQAAIEGHMAAMLRSLAVLAAAGEAPAWASVSPALKSIGQMSPTKPTGWLAAPDGSYQSTFDNAKAPDNLTARPFFDDLLAGRSVTGEAIVSKVSGQRAVVIAQPILRNGKVQGAVGVEISARAIMDVFHDYFDLPDGLSFVVINDAGLIVLHSERGRIFQNPDLAEPSMAAAIKRIVLERSGVVRYQARGIRRVGVFNKSDALGWHFMLVKTSA
jgi:C4-dicarboxylate-specific signal transduction histidine kinase